MRTIAARNVNRAFTRAMNILTHDGVPQQTRNGPVLAMDAPFACTYYRPWERVLFNKGRRANPFFHLFESFWMLGGRNDATWLDTYVHDFSARFAEPTGLLHGAYGYRWRSHFGYDQIDDCVKLLCADQDTRQVVLTMWDPGEDLGTQVADRPCNTHIYFRVQQPGEQPVLGMTVCNRSNDAVWGMFGANAVHMSVLHEYMAWRTDYAQGSYVQISNNLHLYQSTADKWTNDEDDPYAANVVVGTALFGGSPHRFEAELDWWLQNPTQQGEHWQTSMPFANLLVPMAQAWDMWKQGDKLKARAHVQKYVEPLDWKKACHDWMAPKPEQE